MTQGNPTVHHYPAVAHPDLPAIFLDDLGYAVTPFRFGHPARPGVRFFLAVTVDVDTLVFESHDLSLLMQPNFSDCHERYPKPSTSRRYDPAGPPRATRLTANNTDYTSPAWQISHFRGRQLRGHGPITRRPVEEMAFIDSWERPFA
jgi:hypothetical protein